MKVQIIETKYSFLFTFLILIGCVTTTYYVADVDALVSNNVSNVGKKYIIVPGNLGTSQEDLVFVEFSKYIDKILSRNGFIKSNTCEESDIIIGMSYGITGPYNKVDTIPLPIYVDNTEYIDARGYINPSPVPQFKTQFVPIVSSSKEYFRYLFLVAYDTKEYVNTQKLLPIWQIFVGSFGYSNDLRRVFPALAVAASSYIGKNTKGKIRITLKEKDIIEFFSYH